MSSQTADITGYYLKSRLDGKSYVIIDTPGFADTSNRDDVFTTNLYKFFKRTKLKLRGVCFVMKSNENRVGPVAKFVISKTLDFFGKDSIENIFAMCTFASMNVPECKEIIDNEGI